MCLEQVSYKHLVSNYYTMCLRKDQFECMKRFILRRYVKRTLPAK